MPPRALPGRQFQCRCGSVPSGHWPAACRGPAAGCCRRQVRSGPGRRTARPQSPIWMTEYSGAPCGWPSNRSVTAATASSWYCLVGVELQFHRFLLWSFQVPTKRRIPRTRFRKLRERPFSGSRHGPIARDPSTAWYLRFVSAFKFLLRRLESIRLAIPAGLLLGRDSRQAKGLFRPPAGRPGKMTPALGRRFGSELRYASPVRIASRGSA